MGFSISKDKKIILTFDFTKLVKLTDRYMPVISNWQQQSRWREFHRQHPTLIEHTKPYKAPPDLVNKLIQEGVVVHDREQTERIIYSHNYFRLKAYFIPFMVHGSSVFVPGTTFSAICELYQADQKIRDFLFPIIAELEIRIRAVIDNEVTRTTNDPFWHLNPSNFKDYEQVKTVLNKAGQRFKAGKQEFALHHLSRYYTARSFDYCRIPPFWVISEIFTFEQLNSVAKALDKTKFAVGNGNNKLHECAIKFGFTSYDSLLTNLKCIQALRNIAAHHSRLWNRNLQAPNAVNKKVTISPIQNNRLYSNLILLRVMCKSQNIPDGIAPFFSNLINVNPTLAAQMDSMGFPPHWETDPLWSST